MGHFPTSLVSFGFDQNRQFLCKNTDFDQTLYDNKFQNFIFLKIKIWKTHVRVAISLLLGRFILCPD